MDGNGRELHRSAVGLWDLYRQERRDAPIRNVRSKLHPVAIALRVKNICQTFAGSRRALISPLKKETLVFGPSDLPSDFLKNTMRQATERSDAHPVANSTYGQSAQPTRIKANRI